MSSSLEVCGGHNRSNRPPVPTRPAGYLASKNSRPPPPFPPNNTSSLSLYRRPPAPLPRNEYPSQDHNGETSLGERIYPDISGFVPSSYRVAASQSPSSAAYPPSEIEYISGNNLGQNSAEYKHLQKHLFSDLSETSELQHSYPTHDQVERVSCLVPPPMTVESSYTPYPIYPGEASPPASACLPESNHNHQVSNNIIQYPDFNENFFVEHEDEYTRSIHRENLDRLLNRKSSTHGTKRILPNYGESETTALENFEYAVVTNFVGDPEMGKLVRKTVQQEDMRTSILYGNVEAKRQHDLVLEKAKSGVRFKCCMSSFAGAVVALTSRDNLSKYPFFKLYLRDIQDHFGETKYKYNENYSAARKIFNKNTSGTFIRKAIRAQHAALFRSGVDRCKKGMLRSTENLLQLLSFGLRRGKPRLFTYILNDEYFCCTETGQEFSKDILSKHAVLNSAQEMVLMAGEFFFYWENDSPYLIIDNNSGTYAPGIDGLLKIKNLLQVNFPAVRILTFDREEPAVVAYKNNIIFKFVE